MFLEVLLIVIILLLTIISFHFAKCIKYKELNEKIGSSQSLPFFGVFFTLFDWKEVLEWPKIIKNTNSKSAFAWFGPFDPVFFTYNREFAEKVLLSPDCNKKSKNYSIIEKEVGPGLVQIGGLIWKRHRKLLNPSFNHRNLMHSFLGINKKSSYFVKELESVVGMGEVELFPLLQKLVLKTSVAFLMGYELQDNNKEHVLLMDHFRNFEKLFTDRMAILTLNPDLLFRWSKFYKPYLESKQFVFNFIQKLMQNEIQALNSNENMKKTNLCYLQQAIEVHLNGGLTFNEVFSEMITILLASFDTSVFTLETLLLMLAMHSEYQEKLFEEVHHHYPDKEFDVKYEDIQQLVFMDQFVNETLRVFSAVPIIGRKATRNIQISDDIVIPSGTNIVIDLFKMHRDQDNWGPYAEHFNPDNFLPENLIGKPSCSFVPFAKGLRNCIASRYAIYFLKSSLAKIVRNYHFKTKLQYEDLHVLAKAFLKHTDPPLIEVCKR